MSQIMINVTQLNQLISVIKELVKQQKFSSVTSTKLLIIYAFLLAENTAQSESSQIHEVLMCLSCELIVTISDVTLQDKNQLIKQIVKKINKTKKQKIQKKVLIAHRLSSEDVIVITDTAVIKKQMKKSAGWLITVSSKTQINHRCFTIMIHDM